MFLEVDADQLHLGIGSGRTLPSTGIWLPPKKPMITEPKMRVARAIARRDKLVCHVNSMVGARWRVSLTEGMMVKD